MSAARLGRTISAIAVLTIAALPAAPAGASAGLTWGPVAALSQPGQAVAAPQIATDPAGDATAIWYRDQGSSGLIESSLLPAGGAWGAAQQLPAGASAYGPELGVDAHGNASALWYEVGTTSDAVGSATRPASGAWTPGPQLAQGDEPRIAVNANGDAVAAWYSFNATAMIDVVYVATRPAGGSWSAAQQVSTPNLDGFAPVVGIDAAGNATAIWQEQSNGLGVITGASRPAGGTWSAAQAISAPTVDSAGPDLAVDAAGAAVAVWYSQIGATSVIESANRAPGGSWSQPASLSGGGDAFDPHVGIDAAGNAVAVWYSFDGANDVVQTATQAAGAWGPPQAISVASQSADEPRIAVDAAGDAAAVWYRFNGNADVTEGTVRAAGAGWSPPQQLSSASESFAPQIAITSQGGPVAVWGESHGGSETIYATGTPVPVTAAGAGTTTGTGGLGGAGLGPGGLAPVLSGLRISPSRFRAGPRTRALISYRDSEKATTTFSVRALGAKTRCRSRRHGCARRGRLIATFTHRDRAGRNVVRFSGRFNGRALAPGRYALVASPRAGRRTGAARQVAFRILRAARSRR